MKDRYPHDQYQWELVGRYEIGGVSNNAHQKNEVERYRVTHRDDPSDTHWVTRTQRNDGSIEWELVS